MFETEQQVVETQIRAYLQANGLPVLPMQWNWIPFSGQWGLSTSFFQVAAAEAKTGAGPQMPVPQRAQALAQGAADALGTPPGFARVEAVKGYLNLYFISAGYARRVVDAVLDQGADFGRGEPRSEQVMVEFSQPNTHKAMHVGHLRSAILGDVVCRVLAFAGYDVVRANYFGDIGLHVIKWLWNYMKYHRGQRPPEDITRWVGDLYIEANRRLEEDPTLEAEVREVYARWDRRDPEVVALWQETRQWSIDGFNHIYDILDIKFDRLYANSLAEEPGKAVVRELIEKGIAEDQRPDGPVIVKIDEKLGLKDEKYRVLVVLRSDGTALYATEDLALAKIKFSEYDLARSIYVVDVRQSLHFSQVFKTLELAGYPWAERCFHLSYELVNLPGNVVLASREGNVVLLEDLVREATARAYEIVQEKNPELAPEAMQAVARAVGLGAIKYPMLARENTKLATFDWEAALDFNGQAAPYIQYAHVRANSILRKAGGEIPAPLTPPVELQPAEVALIDLMTRMPRVVQQAAAEYKPLHIANLAFDLAKAFSDFYNQCPVLNAEPEVRAYRLRLVAAARTCIANSLALLGITAPQAM